MGKLLLAAAMLVIGVGPAVAQRVCMSHEQMVKTLTEKYSERLYVRVFSQRGFVIEVWGNERADTWTFVATDAAGLACMVDSGGSFEVFIGDPV